ncbi:Ketoreductase [Lachnellula occidentalis]|uniref:Ketoreductase n=1 Tax=Lachnellula occidentalis TaxID=215460 RepID=A0A8H8UK39_9HELO|nr:Ketoreductase [Lachnellula occidentalis]
MKVFLSGGSGFIAAHVLDILLEHGHTVITSVRSQEKANKIKEAHPNTPASQLEFRIVKDIAQEGAFDEAVKIDGLEAVIHTASPFHFNITDVKKDLLDPAIIGTTGILKAIKKNAPSVKRVVITSSFASIINPSKGNSWTEHTYSEKDWNPITEEEAVQNPSNGYRASKTFAEKAAWEFVEKEKPNFTLSTMCPPLVIGKRSDADTTPLGPIVHYLNSLDSLNTSNQRTANLMTGKNKSEIPDTGTFIWVDVRDLALAHVKAIELPEAANKRFFITAGYFSNKEICEIIRKNFPAFEKELPAKDVKGGDYPKEGVYKYDNSRTVNVLGIKFRSLEESVVDLVKSLQAVGA